MEGNIGQRQEDILRAVVESHSSNHLPVGSRTLSKMQLSELSVSPATIRNVMADLDEMGYTVQPHTSAGRVPTDKGYRYFIDNLMSKKKLSVMERKLINNSLDIDEDDWADLLQAASNILCNLSDQVSIIRIPKLSSIVVDKFHFIKVNDFKVQVVLVTSAHAVKNLLVELDENLSDSELTLLANFVNARYAGQTLINIQQKLRKRIRRENDRMNRMRERALDIQEKLIQQQKVADILVEGTSKFLEMPEFSHDSKKLKKLFDLLSNKRRLLMILDKCLDKRKAKANIGAELSTAGFEECAIVSCGYGLDDDIEGTIGIIGPRHMDYPYAFALLEYLSGALSRKIHSE